LSIVLTDSDIVFFTKTTYILKDLDEKI